MRLYEGKAFERSLSRRFRRHSESRDGIVWAVDTNANLVQCKIQGSDNYILCHYPRNWQDLPPWCKRGNAVRIVHKGGMRSYFEVADNGRAIPTPITGSQFPTEQTLYDGVLTGGEVTAYVGMYISIGNTTYRIDGVTYTMDVSGGYIVMDDPAPMTMGGGLLMGIGNAIVLLDAAPAVPNSRYDLIVVGTDNQVDVITGTAAATPVMPSLPADHVRLAHVLVLGGVTEIEQQYINALFEPRYLAAITFALTSGTGTITDGEFEWHISNNTPDCNVTATMRCQYGWALTGSYDLTLEKLWGTGQIYSATTGWDADEVVQSIVDASSYAFKYQRDQLASEISPILVLSIAGAIESGAERIPLLDSLGGAID